MQGGGLRNGFISAGFSQFGGGSLIGQVVVGGTISRVTGGKFANGAGSAAFAWAVRAGLSSQQSSNGGHTAEEIANMEKGLTPDGRQLVAGDGGLISQKELSEIFKDEQFKKILARGLSMAKGDVETRFQLQGDNISSGSVIRYKEASWFSSKEGYYIDGLPSSNTVRGLTETGGFAGALQPLEGVKALAISLDRWQGNRGITSASSVDKFNSLSRFVEAPVVVSGRGADTFIFDGSSVYSKFD